VYDVPTQYQVMSPTTVYHPPFFLNLLTFDRLTLIHNVGNMISSGKRVNTIKIYYVKYGNPIGATKNVRHDRLRWMWVEGMIIIASCPRSPSRTISLKNRVVTGTGFSGFPNDALLVHWYAHLPPDDDNCVFHLLT